MERLVADFRLEILRLEALLVVLGRHEVDCVFEFHVLTSYRVLIYIS